MVVATVADLQPLENENVLINEQSSFITAHRVSLTYPSSLDVVHSAMPEVPFRFQVTLDRLPVVIARHRYSGHVAHLAVPVGIDGDDTHLKLPLQPHDLGDSSNSILEEDSSRDETARDNIDRKVLWQRSVLSFCNVYRLSDDNQAWLLDRVSDLSLQLDRGLLGAPDAEAFHGISICLSVQPSNGDSSSAAPGEQRRRNHVKCGEVQALTGEIEILVPRLAPGTYKLELTDATAYANTEEEYSRIAVPKSNDGINLRAAQELPGAKEVELPPTLIVQPPGCGNGRFQGETSREIVSIVHPRHGALLGSTVELQLISDNASSATEFSVCLSLDATIMGCHPRSQFALDAYLRELSPGRHAIEAWRQCAIMESNDEAVGDDGASLIARSNASSTESNSRGCECRSMSSFEVAEFESPASSRLRVKGIVPPLFSSNDDESSNDDNDINYKADNADEAVSDETEIGAERDEQMSLVFVTGASQRYFDSLILQNLIGSLHWWEPEAPIEVWDFGLSGDASAQISTWRNVQLKTLPPPTPRSLPSSTLPEAQASVETVPAHMHVAGFGAYAAKAWATRDALRRWSHIAQRGHYQDHQHNSPKNGPEVYVLWIDANCELRRPLHGSLLPHRLASRGAFFVTHPYGFPSPQFHFPATVAALGCPAADSTASIYGSNTGENAPLGRSGKAASVALESLQHCATTFMGFTLATPQGRAVADHVLEPLVQCSLDPNCVHPQGSSRNNHRQEQTALNAILCRLSHGESAAEGRQSALNKHDERSQMHRDTVDESASRKWNLSAAMLCDNDPVYRLTSDFENRDNLQPTRDPHDWNAMVLYTRRGHPHKPYVAHLQCTA